MKRWMVLLTILCILQIIPFSAMGETDSAANAGDDEEQVGQQHVDQISSLTAELVGQLAGDDGRGQADHGEHEGEPADGAFAVTFSGAQIEGDEGVDEVAGGADQPGNGQQVDLLGKIYGVLLSGNEDSRKDSRSQIAAAEAQTKAIKRQNLGLQGG